MKRVTVNKIASVTAALHLRRQLVLGKEIPARAGTVVVGRVLTNKTSYNKLEDVHGRMSELRAGDVIVGALGPRHALHGYSGVVPESIRPGDHIQLLNLGGVMGVGASPSPGLGAPHQIEVLGSVLSFQGLERVAGRPATVADAVLDAPAIPTNLPPVLTLLGTSMDSGKTTAAAVIIAGLCRAGLRIAAGKLTGVSLRRDTLQMSDAGAFQTSTFTDFGVITTNSVNAAPTAQKVLATLAESEPDLIVLEMGDGLLGTYGVQALLADPKLHAIRQHIVLCAQDPVGAWGAQQLLMNRFQAQAQVVTGPVTDTPVGRSFCRDELSLAAHNAVLDGAALVDQCHQELGLHLDPVS